MLVQLIFLSCGAAFYMLDRVSLFLIEELIIAVECLRWIDAGLKFNDSGLRWADPGSTFINECLIIGDKELIILHPS